MQRLDLGNAPEGFLSFAWHNLSPGDRATIMAEAPRTVWLFGAGASHHYNLNARGVRIPLANGFFTAFHQLPTSSGFNAHVGPLISYLKSSRNVDAGDVPKWSENIEDFMTSIEDELEKLRTQLQEGRLSEDSYMQALSAVGAFNNMTFIMASVINEAQNGPSDSLYRDLLDFCGPNDTFITFNWDTLMDRALADTGGWSPNDGYGLSFASVLDSDWKPTAERAAAFKTNWKLLKLHGSTNWLVPWTNVRLDTLDYHCAVNGPEKIFLYWQSTLPYQTFRNRWRGGYVPTSYGYYPANIPSAFFGEGQLAPEAGHAFLSFSPIQIFSPFKEIQGEGIPSSPLLITPVRQKKYDSYQESIESLWKQAGTSIKDAQRLVIVGYSFPATDTRTLELVGSAAESGQSLKSIEIVCPDANEIASRLTTRFAGSGKRIIVHAKKFEDYIGSMYAVAPYLMRLAADGSGDVKDWLERIFQLNQLAREEP